MLLYILRVSENIRRACVRYNLRVIFRSSWTLHSMLTMVKDRLPQEKLSKVVYQIPCDCSKVYIGETTQRLETRLKEHWDAHRKGMTETSMVAEHAWDSQHAIQWKERPSSTMPGGPGSSCSRRLYTFT